MKDFRLFNIILLVAVQTTLAFTFVPYYRQKGGAASLIRCREKGGATSLIRCSEFRSIRRSTSTLSRQSLDPLFQSPKDEANVFITSPNIKNNFVIVSQLSIFIVSIVAISYGFHVASFYQWLGISSSAWDKVSISYPIMITISFLYNLVMYKFVGGGEQIAKIMGGEPMDQNHDGKTLINSIEEIYLDSGLPLADQDGKSLLPSLWLIPTHEPNAFAAGIAGKDGVVAVTSGLLHNLNTEEQKAVIAHEIGHLRNKDTIKAVQLASMIAALGFVIDQGFRMLNSGNIQERNSNDDDEEGDNGATVAFILIIAGAITYSTASLLRLASSRSAEYDADDFAKSIDLGEDLASALEKIDGDYGRDSKGLGAASGAFAHSYISNPPSRENPLINLFGLLRTHPTTTERVARLRKND